MAQQATKRGKADKPFPCIVSVPEGQGIMIDHKNCARGTEVTPEDPGLMRLLIAENRLIKAGTHKAKELLKAVAKEKTADKKVATDKGYMSKADGKELSEKAVAETKRADDLQAKLDVAEGKLAEHEGE